MRRSVTLLPISKRFQLGLLLAAFWLALSAPLARAANIERFLTMCENKQLCPWFLAVVKVPKGWRLLKEESKESKVQMLLPKGEPNPEQPLIYIKARHDPDNQDVEDFATRSQKLWLEKLPDSTVERLADFEREAKPKFLVYMYRNPSQPSQAFELTAFTRDSDSEHPEEHYVFQAVLTASSMQAVEEAKAAFFEVLQSL